MPLYGNPQSTFIDELNRLAAGGGTSYPPISTYKDESAATAQWAVLRGVIPSVSQTVGILNEIQGNIRPNWYDLAGVCNQIAGTSNMEAAEALRYVYS